MDDWPTDAMIDAAQAVAVAQDGHVANMGYVLEVALVAAPTADGWTWCEHLEGPIRKSRHQLHLLPFPDGAEVCPGSHKTLIVGRTVETT